MGSLVDSKRAGRKHAQQCDLKGSFHVSTLEVHTCSRKDYNRLQVQQEGCRLGLPQHFLSVENLSTVRRPPRSFYRLFQEIILYSSC